MWRPSLVFCLLLALGRLRVVVGDDPDEQCPKKGAKSATMTLKKLIFCNYDSTVRPAKDHTNSTDVTMFMWLKFFVFTEHYNTMDVHSWVVWQWRDEHLTWDKSEHSNIDKLQISSSELWVPDVATYNAGNLDATSTGIPETRCTLYNDGNVSCVSPTVYSAHCRPDIRSWPFDSHNCSVRVGSWSHTGAQINLTLDSKGISISDYEENREWELLSYNATLEVTKYKNVSYPWVTFRFELRRHPGGQAAAILIPAIVLAMMTLTTFWIDPDSAQRLGLICINIVCHCLYMMFLAAVLPANGDSTPIIVTFFRDSFLLAGISLLVTLCAARMILTKRVPPAWIATITDGVLAFPPGQFLLLGELDPKVSKGVAAARGGVEESAELVGGATATSGWGIFSILLDRVFFLIFLLTLFILLCAYIP